MTEWTKDIGGSCRLRARYQCCSMEHMGFGADDWMKYEKPGEQITTAVVYLTITVETIVHATDSTKRQWVAIASAVSVEGDVIDGPDANGLDRDPVVKRTERVRAMLCQTGGMQPSSIPLSDLYDLLRTAWADVRRVA